MINPSDIHVNYYAVLVAAVASMVIGYLWYGPLFGQEWGKLLGIKIESVDKNAAMKSYLWGYLFAAVTAYVLAHFVQLVGATDWMGGVSTGFWVWLGFFFTTTVMNIMYEMKPMKLAWINVGYQLVNLLVMGAILAGWPY